MKKYIIKTLIFLAICLSLSSVSEAQYCYSPNFLNSVNNTCINQPYCAASNSVTKGSCVGTCIAGQVFDSYNSNCVKPKTTCNNNTNYLNTAQGIYFNSCLNQAECTSANTQTKGSCVLSCPSGKVFDITNNQCVTTPTCPANTYLNTAQGTYFNQCLNQASCISANTQTKGSCVLSCGAGEIFDSYNNMCVKPPTCKPPTNYLNTVQGNQYSNTCIDTPHCAAVNTQNKGSCILSCPTGQVFNELNSMCVTPAKCTYPQFLNTVDNTCITQQYCAAGNNSGGARNKCVGSCTAPRVFDTTRNDCIDLPSCVAPSFLNVVNNLCITPTYCAMANFTLKGSCVGSCLLPAVFDTTTSSCIVPPTVIDPSKIDTSFKTSSKSSLFVTTSPATDITYTTAKLNGTAGDLFSSITLPITAYFRYSKLEKPPIFCNDIYGTRMVSTKDKNIGLTSSQSFSQLITNLIPDTTYYFCAIASNRNEIAYGGTSIVKSFKTKPYQTTIKTISATNVDSSSAQLNGSFNSIEKVTTYFEYKVASTEATSIDWKKTREITHVVPSGQSNVYGNIKYPDAEKDELKLSPSTRYQFRAVAKTNVGAEVKLTYGNTLSFTTSPVDTSSVDPKQNCPTGYTGRYPNCISRGGTGVCPTNYTGTYPNCAPPVCPAPYKITTENGEKILITEIYFPALGRCEAPAVCTSLEVYNAPSNTCSIKPPYICDENPNDPSCLPGPGWTWNSNGTWTGGNWLGGNWVGGDWIGGNWVGGTWTGNDGKSCSGGTWSRGSWTGLNCTGNLAVGQTATPPSDAIVRFEEGIEHVFVRQITTNDAFAKLYGYQEGTDLQAFAWDLADQFARAFGYISGNGREIRVSRPDVAAYELQLVGNKLTVYEYYYNKIIDVRNVTTVFKNASGYEYYFKP